MKKTKEEIISLAESLNFNLNDQELEKIVNEYNSIEQSLSKLKKMNLDKIEPTLFVHGNDLELMWQEDEPIEYDAKKVFSNSKYENKGYVEIKNEK